VERRATLLTEPRFVYVAPDSEHVAVHDHALLLDVFTRNGARARVSSRAWFVMFVDDGLVMDEERERWDGEYAEPLKSPLSALTKQVRAEDGYVTTVGLADQNRRAELRWALVVSAAEIGGARFWVDTVPGDGAAAIGDDWRPVLARADGEIVVYGVGGTRGPGGPLDTITAPVRGMPYEISVIGRRYAVLAVDFPRRQLEPWSEDWLRQENAIHRFVTVPERAARPWRPTLHVFDENVQPLWSVELPFEVLQPPIHGGDGRVYLVGNGFAAAADGRILWTQACATRCYATAFEEGTVAFALGPELRIVSSAGETKQTLRIPDGVAITAPPAIDGDGSIWLATSNGLYHVQ
jgi:hypothetical protein